ncbi:hypothetical protein ScPMuIL_003660 [Solemya velum]
MFSGCNEGVRIMAVSWDQFSAGHVFDDWSNRLNNFWTFYLLLLLSAVIGWQMYQSDRAGASCLISDRTLGVDFVNRKCWEASQIGSRSFYQSNVIVESMDPYVHTGPRSAGYDATYYQWIPVILAFQALLFKLPDVIWLLFNGYAGIHMRDIYRLTNWASGVSLVERRYTSTTVARYLNNWLNSCIFARFPWRVLTILTGITKFLYLVNALKQFTVIDSFLLSGTGNNFGYHVLEGLKASNFSQWTHSPRFPRSVLCEFEMRSLHNVHEVLTQCVLPLNELQEQVYLFVWVWLLFVTCVTVYSFIVWAVTTIVPNFKIRYIKRLLVMSPDMDTEKIFDNDIRTFACNYLGNDGVLVLEAIGENASLLLVSDIVVSMWSQQFSPPLAQSRGHVITTDASDQVQMPGTTDTVLQFDISERRSSKTTLV